MNIGKWVVVHTLFEVDGIKDFQLVAMLQKSLTSFDHHVTLRTSKLGQFTEVSEFVRVTVLFRALHHLLLIVLSYL